MNKTKNKKSSGVLWIMCIFIILLFFIYVSSDSCISDKDITVKDRTIRFSADIDLLKLNIEKSTSIEKYVPRGFFISGIKTQEVDINISPEECKLLRFNEWDRIDIGNLKSFTKPGDPQLPMKTFVVKLPKDAKVLGIYTKEGNYKQILNRLNIMPTPQPQKMNEIGINSYHTDLSGKFFINNETYSLNSYFPGKIFSYDIGKDNQNIYVLIRFYPLQYNPYEKKAVLITNAKMFVEYKTIDKSSMTSSSLSSEENAIIITPEELKIYADSLASFHNNTGIATTVVTTEYIWNNFNAAPDPSYEGYKDSFLPGKDNITNYNYTLAKKIISFLNKSNNAKYVILFGNAKLVPPSYYIYDKQIDCGYCELYECIIDYYNSWIPTDYLYSSPDYDLIPNYAVGRIPVNNASEASHFVQKINDWYSNLNWSWFKNVAVAGGRPFLDTRCGSGRYDEIFTGEIDTIDVINKGYFSGMNVTTFFRTDKRFNKAAIKDVLSGGYGMVYYSAHGGVDLWALDDDFLKASDIMNLNQNSKVPIIVASTCLTGAYDTNLMDPYYANYDKSFSEGVLNSNAGGIVYIGASRTAYSGIVVYFKNGSVWSIDEKYITEIGENIFKAYHSGADSIGNLTISAIFNYVLDNNFDDRYNRRTLFEFVLLGDPALKIPIQQSENYTEKPKLNVVNSQGDREIYFPWAYGNMPTYSSGSNVTVICQADSPTVKIKLIAIDKWENETIDIQNVNVINGNATYIFKANETHLYLVRCIDNNSKEGWLYVNQPFALFADSYNDQAVDLDNDGKYDYLTVDVSVDVKKPGKYIVKGKLCDKSYCVHGFSLIDLTSGSQIVSLNFDGHEIYKRNMSGNYKLVNLYLYNIKDVLDIMPVDYKFNPYNTSYYSHTMFESDVSKTAYIDSDETTYDDYGLNTDSTSYYNYLITEIRIYAEKAGYYNVGGILYGYYSEGWESFPYKIGYASNYTYLDAGYNTVSLKFDGHLVYYFGDLYNGITTQYMIVVLLSDNKGNDLDYKYLKTNNDYDYENFERLKDIFTGSYSSSGIDIDNNGLFDYLSFTAEANIPSPGYYYVTAELYDSKNHKIDFSSTILNLTSGYHDIQLNFSGWKIHSNGIDGPYQIIGLKILDENLTVMDFKLNPHNTTYYDFSSFESLPWKILLVDDDKGKYYEDDYKDALDHNGYSYKYWDVNSTGSPDLSTLSLYDVVIWFTGKDYKTTLTAQDQENLKNYLDNGGKLFISGQDIGYDIGETSFYQNYLHATYISDNKNTTEITGIFGDFISDGLDINQYGSSPDVISVKNDAIKIFDYVGGSYEEYPAAGLRYSGNYRVVYLPFGFEFASNQNILMDRIIKWLLQPTSFKNYSSYGEDTNGNGLYNYLVINIALNVSEAGNYIVSGNLYDENLNFIDNAETKIYLDTGMQTVKLKFDGYKIYNHGISGKYKLKFLSIKKNDAFYPLDYVIEPYTTPYYAYTSFDKILTGNYEESTDNIYEQEGGNYKYLTINVSVNITSPGYYIVSGELYDNNGIFITKASNLTYLNPGIQVVKLNFRGFDIYNNNADGEYYLYNLYIKDRAGNVLDYEKHPYTTFHYAYKNFKVENQPFCSCSDCENCTYILNNNFCPEVKLTANIINHSGTCINNPENFNNKIFDCQGHRIDGDNSGQDYGIFLNGKQNNTIKNCIITGFYNGIYLLSSSNTTLINNKILNNTVGICSENSNSTINNNIVCNNANSDFNSSNWLSSYGDNNKCDKPDGWHDNGINTCRSSCNCTSFDFDNNNYVDIFDVVLGLENLSEGREIYNIECTTTDKITLNDLLKIMEEL